MAERLIAASGKKIDVVFTGLRPNEKMHEVLLSGTETATRSNHPLISQVPVPALKPTDLENKHLVPDSEIVQLRREAPTRQPTETSTKDSGTVPRNV